MDRLSELSVKHLRALVALSRYGKFTAAAAELGISQPGLSRIVQQAEDQLGVPLFTRGTRTVVQTDAGRAFIPAAERLVKELEQQSRQLRMMSGTLRGQLIISCLMSISHHVLPAALVAFKQRHPYMHIRVREGLQGSIQDDVRTGAADFGLGSPPGARRGLCVQSVVEESCHVVLPKEHRLAGTPHLALADIADQTFVSMPAESGLRTLIDSAAGAEGIRLDHSIIINQYQSLFDFVSSNLGIAIVPASALSPARHPDVVVSRLRPDIRRRVGVLFREGHPLTAACEEFLTIFQPMLLRAAGTVEVI